MPAPTRYLSPTADKGLYVSFYAPAFDPGTGMGVSTQPLYSSDAAKPPQMLVLGRYYPAGKLGAITEERKAELQSVVQADLGDDYTVTVVPLSQPSLEGVELHVIQSERAG